MSHEIKAIETNYKGYRMRSRLEARWAVFFDAIGIEWEYEPQGFEKGELRYLPDFHLPKTKTWVEVKGSTELLRNEAEFMDNFLDWGCPLPDFDESANSHFNLIDSITPGLLILGSIPEPKFGITLHPIIQHNKGLVWSWACFLPWAKLEIVSFSDFLATKFYGDELNKILSNDDDRISTGNWFVESLHIPTSRGWNQIKNAYAAARSARFEHGETPR